MIKNLLNTGFALLFFMLTTTSNAQKIHVAQKQIKKSAAEIWVDSVYNSLTLEERIGQLFMVAAYSGGEKFNQEQIEPLIKNHQIGGLIFMQGTAEAQVKLTNKYQQMAQVPLLIGMDAEWGLGMRLTGVKNFPRQMMLGATRDTQLMYAVGKAIASQCKRIGVHVDFAPVVDVNNNPANPVINFRSFGEDKEWVSKMGIAYMHGLQDNGVMACAKHFPGHGDVSIDSHLDLPVVNKTKAELETTEFYPFKCLSDAGVQSMMIAHLSMPHLDKTPNLPTTLSKNVVTDLLKNELGFKGLIFTDALNMKGVTKYFPDGETDLKAFLAGNDVLLFSQDVPLAIRKIKKALASGVATEERLAYSVKKILLAKYQYGLNHFAPIDVDNATTDCNKDIDSLSNVVARAAVTIVSDKGHAIEKLLNHQDHVAYLAIGDDTENSFYTALQANGIKLSPLKISTDMLDAKNYETVIVGIHKMSLYPGKDGNYGIKPEDIAKLNKLKSVPYVIFVYFGNAYAQKITCSARNTIVAYEDSEYCRNAVAALLSGKINAKGVLPVKVCE